MRNYNSENERIKRKYFAYLKEAQGRDEKTVDIVAASLVKFETSTKFKPFKKFHIEQARGFKDALDAATNKRTGKPLSLTTIDATLRHVKGFFHWLAGQQGYKKVLSYADVEYFNNNAKKARAAHTQRMIPFPSIEAALHAFEAMPNGTDIQKRDRAIFAFLMLAGARDGATASFKLKHVNLVDGSVFQDGREVKTKNASVFSTTFFPVDPAYLDCFTEWVKFLKKDKLFGNEDALFPKPLRELDNGKFSYQRLSRETYGNAAKINEVVRNAFAMVQMPEYTPHSFRKTLTWLMNDLNLPLEAQKAWSQNLGHKNFSVTANSYLPITEAQKHHAIKELTKK